MSDREKVIKGLEDCSSREAWKCSTCKWYDENSGECFTKLAADALTLLREKEPVDAIRDGESYGKNDFGAWWYACGRCHGVIDYKDKFCRHCGREVKWE